MTFGFAAVLALLLVLLENVFRGHSALGSLLLAHASGFSSSAFRHSFRIAVGEEQARALLGDTDHSALENIWGWMDPLGLVASPALWIGLVVAAGFTAVAIVVRRYRDDT